MGGVLKTLRPQEWVCLAVDIVFIVVQVYFDLRIPDYMAKVTMLVETPGTELAEVMTAGLMMLGCAAGSLLATIGAGFFSARLAAGVGQTVRATLFDKTLGFSLTELNKFSAASLITRSTNDITQIQIMVAMGLQALVKAPIMAVWAIAKMAGKSWEWTATAGGVIGVLALVVIVLVVLVVPRFVKIQRMTDEINRIAREGITGIRDVRAYNAEAYQQGRFGKANDDLTGVHLFTSRALAFMMPTMTLAMSCLTLAVYWVGIFLISGANMALRVGIFADMVAFSSYAVMVVAAFMMLTITFVMLPRALVSVRRVSEVINTEVSITDGPSEVDYKNVGGSISFQNVSFRYPNASENALSDLIFTIDAGSTVAIIGSTGSGKTTLLNLIARLHEATKGTVSVGGTDVRTITQRSLRTGLALATQKPFLFSDSVRGNVAYGLDDATDEQIHQALDIAQASEFVDPLPDGIETAVAQGGTNFSGGQRQRLSIARAVCRQPKIYLFDDTFSALDYKTDQQVRSALASWAADATVVIVAQRVGTIMDADNIIVLDEGRIVGMGTHEELLDSCRVYREIASSQLSEEEMHRD